MTSSGSHLSDTQLDALAECVCSGLEGPDGRVDAPSLVGVTESDVYSFEAAAAAIACACAVTDEEALPDMLRARCIGAARALSESRSAPSTPVSPAPLRFTTPASTKPRAGGLGLGWLAAAACLAIAAVAWWPSSAGTVSPSQPTPEQRMQSLVASADDLDRWDWQPWDPSMDGVTGEVVWSEAAQEGYMVLSGLPVNDPSQEQYQLWVVESSRGTPLEVPPVDGGVFNVTEAGETVIPIRCAIPAEGVVAFAVTIEQPGGVVVSDRDRKAVIAQAPAKG